MRGRPQADMLKHFVLMPCRAVGQVGAERGIASHDAYLKAFADQLAAYAKAGYILKEDADAMRSRAALCAPLTFTEMDRDHYDAFTVIVHTARCGRQRGRTAMRPYAAFATYAQSPG